MGTSKIGWPDVAPTKVMVGATDWLIDAAQRATQTIPIVALFTEDPVTVGLVTSLARPGGNLTGVTTTSGRLDEKRLELLSELAPQAIRIGFLGRRAAWEAYRSGADPSTLPPVFAAIDRPEQYEEAFAILLRERVDALLVSYGPVLFFRIPRIVTFVTEKRLPAVYPWREAVDAGGLMSYGTNVQALFQQAAGFVDRILKGAKPGDLPIEQPTKYELAFNLKAARALNLTPAASILIRADEVIE
jgi:putative ABC transport system substrate-binding protein